jgi:PAS domain S-box-containing protein
MGINEKQMPSGEKKEIFTAGLYQILDKVSDATVVIDHHGIVTFWNQQAEKLFGWTSHEVARKKMTDLILLSKYAKTMDQEIDQFLKTKRNDIFNDPTVAIALTVNRQHKVD